MVHWSLIMLAVLAFTAGCDITVSGWTSTETIGCLPFNSMYFSYYLKQQEEECHLRGVCCRG